jgi:hypothetical protein
MPGRKKGFDKQHTKRGSYSYKNSKIFLTGVDFPVFSVIYFPLCDGSFRLVHSQGPHKGFKGYFIIRFFPFSPMISIDSTGSPHSRKRPDCDRNDSP